MAQRASAVGEKFEQRQNNTQETLDLLITIKPPSKAEYINGQKS